MAVLIGLFATLLLLPSLACSPGRPIFKEHANEPIRLTRESSQDFYPAWSPDGQRIAFISDRSGAWNLWTMQADGADARPLTNDHQVTAPSWSPDGRWVAYATDRDSGMNFWTDLWQVREDGSEHRVLLKSGSAKEFSPAWHPHGETLAYLYLDMARPPTWEIRILDLKTGRSTAVFTENILFSKLAWSPDGREMVFVSDRTGQPELWVMDPEKRNARPVTNDGAEKEHPAWSPNGRWIAFASKRASHWDLWMIRPDGSGLIQLTASPATDTLPDWHPDGRRIAFTSDRAGSQDIWVIRVE